LAGYDGFGSGLHHERSHDSDEIAQKPGLLSFRRDVSDRNSEDPFGENNRGTDEGTLVDDATQSSKFLANQIKDDIELTVDKIGRIEKKLLKDVNEIYLETDRVFNRDYLHEGDCFLFKMRFNFKILERLHSLTVRKKKQRGNKSRTISKEVDPVDWIVPQNPTLDSQLLPFTYSGIFKNNQFHGQGKMRYDANYVYEGGFDHGVEQGEGYLFEYHHGQLMTTCRVTFKKGIAVNSERVRDFKILKQLEDRSAKVIPKFPGLSLKKKPKVVVCQI